MIKEKDKNKTKVHTGIKLGEHMLYEKKIKKHLSWQREGKTQT